MLVCEEYDGRILSVKGKRLSGVSSVDFGEIKMHTALMIRENCSTCTSV